MSLGSLADVPMCEFWLYGFNTSYSVIEATSIAHTTGRPLVAAEAFTSGDNEHWDAWPGSMKVLGDWAFASGREPVRLSPLPAPAVVGPASRHDHGSVRSALGTNADLVEHGAGISCVPFALHNRCCARVCRSRTSATLWPKVPRTCSSLRGPQCAEIRQTAGLPF